MQHAVQPHILVINDDTEILNFYEALLIDAGYRVTLWTFPKTDSTDLKSVAPDGVVLDFLFGHQDIGRQFLATIKCEHSLPSVPILVCTASARYGDEAEKLLDDSDCGVILKPFEIDEFIDRIDHCVLTDEIRLSTSILARPPITSPGTT